MYGGNMAQREFIQKLAIFMNQKLNPFRGTLYMFFISCYVVKQIQTGDLNIKNPTSYYPARKENSMVSTKTVAKISLKTL